MTLHLKQLPTLLSKVGSFILTPLFSFQAIFPQTSLTQSQSIPSGVQSPEAIARRRSHAKDGEDDPSEKRQKFLERNRCGCMCSCAYLSSLLHMSSTHLLILQSRCCEMQAEEEAVGGGP